jgi:hypothetical protein
MGVMSIVIAGLSALASLVVGVQALAFYFVVARSAARSAAPPRPAAPRQAAVLVPATLPATGPTTGPTSAPTSTGTALTPAEVQAVVQNVQAAAGNGLNSAQLSRLQAVLQDPAQGLVSPGTAGSPIVGVNLQQGNAFIQLSGGWIQLDAQGQVLSQFSTFNPLAGFRLSQAAVVLVAVEAGVSVLLAVLLLVAGILVFRRSPLSRKLHRIYAWLKIPAAVAGGIGIGWMYSSFVGAFAPRGTQGPSAAALVFWMYAVGAAVLGSAYPVGLLITLRSMQVRAYYNSISSG